MSISSGSKNNSTPSRYAALSRSTSGEPVSYRGVDGALLRKAVDGVTSNGDAILFGRTSDGGALCVQVISNGQSTKWYPNDASLLYELLEGLGALGEA